MVEGADLAGSLSQFLRLLLVHLLAYTWSNVWHASARGASPAPVKASSGSGDNIMIMVCIGIHKKNTVTSDIIAMVEPPRRASRLRDARAAPPVRPRDAGGVVRQRAASVGDGIGRRCRAWWRIARIGTGRHPAPRSHLPPPGLASVIPLALGRLCARPRGDGCRRRGASSWARRPGSCHFHKI